MRLICVKSQFGRFGYASLMDVGEILKRHGLFEAKVPRYASYPPANRFAPDIGAAHRAAWLASVRPDEVISLYIHVPFCRRLCWFCASRTQVAKSPRMIGEYVTALDRELAGLRRSLPEAVRIGRLHLGGGTPTRLPPAELERLLAAVFDRFGRAGSFVLSAEVDATDAAPEVLDVLAGHGLARASIGVQDFAPRVQAAIGRSQGFAATRATVEALRARGVAGVDIDVLYGLPNQTADSFRDTLERVLSLDPARLAACGYAQVPWIAARQAMISPAALPGPEARYRMAAEARERLTGAGYRPVGIDHFAQPEDGLAVAAAERRLRRGFQGYTDDPAEVLIGLGASAISRLREGYIQNTGATAAYVARVAETGAAAHRGVCLSPGDRVLGAMIDGLMCYGSVDVPALQAAFPDHADEIAARASGLLDRFGDVFSGNGERFELPPHFICLARVAAASLERAALRGTVHDVAI